MEGPQPVTCAECGAQDVDYLPHNPGCPDDPWRLTDEVVLVAADLLVADHATITASAS